MRSNNLSPEIDTNQMIKDLQRLIKIPSVSARKQNLEECANEIVDMMKEMGIDSELIYFDTDTDTDTADLMNEVHFGDGGSNSSSSSSSSSSSKSGEGGGGGENGGTGHHGGRRNGSKSKNAAIPPLVYGEIRSKSNPTGKTLMFYNHYDVQPEEPIDLWDYDPFEGKVDGNKIFGRGASDDKGELVTRLKAVEYFIKNTGDVPCNIKFVVEGEEEIGSRNISRYLKKYKEKFKADVVIWEFGYIDQLEKPIISLGMKGLLYVELSAQGASRDVHSSLAVLIENPAWKIVKALSTMMDKNGNILIKDWYNEVQDLTDQEMKIIEKEPFDEEIFKKEYGINKFINNRTGKNAKRALICEPTCNISGLYSGYSGEGAKTITPSRAKVKIDFRLVPNMDPVVQFERLKKHLIENGFDDITVTRIHGEAAGRTGIDNPYVKIVQTSANEIFGDSILSISSAGTGPMYDFIQILDAPCISIGGTYIFSKIHSPNEFARIDLLEKTSRCMINIIKNISKI